MITTSTEWDSLSATSRNAPIALVRMYYGDETAYVPLAEKDITFDGDRYLGIILSMPSTSYQLDLEKHEHSVGTFTLELSNVEYQPGSRFSDFITTQGSANDYGFYNRKIEVKLYLEGITSWANCLPLFTGYVRQTKQSQSTVSFTCDDGSQLQDVLKPNNAITSADAPSEYYRLAESAFGKQKPIVYGDRTYNLGTSIRSNFTTNQNNIMTKCIYLGDAYNTDPTFQRQYLVSGHELNQIESIWFYDNQINRYVKVENFDIIQNTSDGAIIGIDQDAVFYDYFFGDGTNTLIGGTNTWSNLDRANDKLASLAATQSDVDGSQTHDLNFPEYDEIISDDAIIDVIIYAFVGTTNSPTFLIDANPVLSDTSPATAGPYGGDVATKAGINNPVRIVYESTDASYEAIIYEIYKRVSYIPSDWKTSNIFASCKGMEYGTWINSRTGHVDDGNSGDLIENAAGILESILRDQMGLATADIDVASFNTLSVGLTNYNLAFTIYENTQTSDILQMILKDSRSYVWQNVSRLWTGDYIADTYSASDFVIDYNEIENPEFEETDINDIKPRIILRYLKSSQSNENQLETIATDSTVLGFYNLTTDQGTLTIETETITDTTASSDLVDYEQLNRQSIHNIVSGSLNKLYLAMDLGDILELSNVPHKISGETVTANATRVGQTIYKYWKVFEIERGERVTFKAIQLHDLS